MEINSKQKEKILVVDDEEDICEVLKFNLENEGFIVEKAHSAEEALTILSDDIQLILLDVMMGGMSGFQMAQKIRTMGKQVPIIFLTSKDTENDMLTGFSVGGDDYISKPFSIKEIIARSKAVLKRGRTEKSPDESQRENIQTGGLEINFSAKQAFISGNTLSLTRKEFEILALLAENQGRVYSRDSILQKVWEDNGYVLDRTVDVHITRLRKKLGVYGACIVNRVGYGYCFNELNV